MANYKGIPGNAYCLSDDCEVDADGKLAKGWYFTPDFGGGVLHQGYRRRVDDADVDESKSYVPETLYAQFGHWLVVDCRHW